MKLTISEIVAINSALKEKRETMEWDVRKYDENGNCIRDKRGDIVPDESSSHYPEWVKLGKLIEKLENIEI